MSTNDAHGGGGTSLVLDAPCASFAKAVLWSHFLGREVFHPARKLL